MMNIPALLRHVKTVGSKYVLKPPRRYRTLLNTALSRRTESILEIGVYTGNRAAEMINAAQVMTPVQSIRYYGFDLFEDLTPTLCAEEYSKMPAPQALLKKNLEKTGATIELFRGFSSDTLPRFVAEHPEYIDLVFIDGGHAEETIRSDWENVRKLMGPETVVFFDDYYCNDPKDVPGIGCQSLIDGLDRSQYDVRICSIEDRFQRPWGTLNIRLARVALRSAPCA